MLVLTIVIYTNSTNIKQLQRLHESNHLLQEEHVHLLKRNQVLINVFNCLAFWAVFISSGNKYHVSDLGSVTEIAFSGTTHMLSASEDGTICVWSCKSWECIKILKGHR